MRKRRVGVTARSRQIVRSQATGSSQIDSEMAAPLELRTPMGTAATAANRVRMEAWRQWRVEDSRQKAVRAARGQNEQEASGGGARALGARYEALPHTPPGGKPPETPGPLSLEPDYFERRESVKGSPAAQKQRAVDRFPPVEGPTEMRERGPMGSGGIAPPVGRPRAVTVMRP